MELMRTPKYVCELAMLKTEGSLVSMLRLSWQFNPSYYVGEEGIFPPLAFVNKSEIR